MRRRRASLTLVAIAALVLLLALCAAALAYHRLVVAAPEAQLTREAILVIISEESPVYYRDGRTPLGVFFAEEHRQYVPWAEIPEACSAALVAAEDKRFYRHHGVDPWGVARAMAMNLRAGELVAGGSTITQQTAKNLFYRPDRSIRSKWAELVNALRLEARFSKQEILEFYFNQFHVSGNGRGLGIAARYFFDREVADLGVQECAFLAGMVKAPSRYNPWTGRTEEERQAAREAARVRTAYVLGRMVETGALDAAQAAALQEQPVPFRRGTFRYGRSVLLDAVEDRLAQEPFPEVFAAAGIDNPSTAGLQIVTTLDRDAQSAATYGLWHHLSELGVYLDKGGIEAFRLPAGSADPAPLAVRPHPLDVLPATVVGVRGEGAARALALDLGGAPAGHGADPTGRLGCLVDRAGLERLAAILRRSREADPHRSARAEDLDAVLDALPPGTVVRASIRAEGEDGFTCDLEAATGLQGAVVVLQQGQIRAMVGGGDNRNFNRATQALRQLGSTWKPLIYYAALQLGWEPDDLLDNRRGVFPYEGTWYYPRPDHDPEPVVSLAWAGTRSENLASVWLLYHLLDRLSAEQLRRVVELVGLAQAPGESHEDWVRRIRDEHGVIATADRTAEAAFDAARSAALADLPFSGHPEDELELRSMSFGRGFEAERLRVTRGFSGEERRVRLDALRRNFLRLETHGLACRDQLAALGSPVDLALKDYALAGLEPSAVEWIHLREADGAVICNPEPLESSRPLATALHDPVALAAWMQAAKYEKPGDVLVEGLVHLSSLEALRRALDAELTRVADLDPWEPELVLHHPDFQRLVAMRYVALVARALGVREELEPVLPMPLGATEVTLIEMASVYQGFLDGSTWRFPGQVFTEGAIPGLRQTRELPASGTPTLLIQEIRDRDGAVLYRAGRERVQVVDVVPGQLVTDVLANVVAHGTGRRAAGALELDGQPWPLLGKTGTTNGYRNAAFLGFLPVAGSAGIDLSASYTIAAYVGYDDNRPMRRGGLRVSGSAGALPAWIATVRGMGAAGLVGQPAPGVPSLPAPAGMVRRAVDERAGLPLPEGALGDPLCEVLAPDPAARPSRRFAPVQLPPDLLPAVPPVEAAPPGPAAEPPTGEPDGEPVGDPEVNSVWDAIEAGHTVGP